VPAPPPRVVPAKVRPGRVVSLGLGRGQRRALGDPDGRFALDVLRHLLGAREAMNAPERFPPTEETFCAVARKLGCPVGQKRVGDCTAPGPVRPDDMIALADGHPFRVIAVLPVPEDSLCVPVLARPIALVPAVR